MVVCGMCARSGKVLYWLDDESVQEPSYAAPKYVPPEFRETEEVVENYALRIRNAMNRLAVKREVVAERINEKLSLLEKFESGNLTPDIKTAKKLEKELGIKLIEKVQEEVTTSIKQSSQFKELTLADMLVEKKKKEK